MKTLFALVPVLALTAVSSWSLEAEAANLLRNPGFETGDFSDWISDRNSAVTSKPGFIPETILTGNHGARIFPGAMAPGTMFLYQRFIIPDTAEQLRFGGNLRFFSFNSFEDNVDQGLIWLYTRSGEPPAMLGIQAKGLSSSLAGNGVTQATNWLFFEGLVDVDGLGGRDAFLILGLRDLGIGRDTAVAFDDLFVEVVEVVPIPIPTPTLLPGLVGLGFALCRKKAGDDQA